MVCNSFDKLTPKEKTEYIGALVHCVQSHDQLFKIGKEIIEIGKQVGLFEGVKIFHEDKKDV
jgi:hypothetical protein